MNQIQRIIGSCLLLTGAITLGCDPDVSSGPTNELRGDEEPIPDAGDGAENECRDCADDDDADDDDRGGGNECALSHGYWKTHPWPAHEGEQLCGNAWTDILWTPPHGDGWYILAYQWIAAKLNVAAGVHTDDEIDAALLAGEALLLTCLVDGGDRPAAIQLAAQLDLFNNSECDDDDHDDDDHHDDCSTTTMGGEDHGEVTY